MLVTVFLLIHLLNADRVHITTQSLQPAKKRRLQPYIQVELHGVIGCVKIFKYDDIQIVPSKTYWYTSFTWYIDSGLGRWRSADAAKHSAAAAAVRRLSSLE